MRPLWVLSWMEETPEYVPEFRQLNCQGVIAWSDGYRAKDNRLVFLSLFGPQATVKSIWASLSAKRGFSVFNAYLDSDVKYIRVPQPIIGNGKNLHLVLIHPDSTRKVSSQTQNFYLIGGVSQFWDRFTRLCPVPVRPEWQEQIWHMGLQKKLIQPLTGFGPTGYMVNVTALWAPHIQDAVQTGVLS